jgi:hypothetical protein
MTKTLEELIERSNDLKCFLQITSYQVQNHKDGSFSDFYVQKVVDLPGLLETAGGLKLKIFADTSRMIVRLYERESE